MRGIPAGGVFAGAEGVKTANQERIFGGDAGSWYDPCYHQACDDITTVLSGVPPLEASGLAVDIPGTRTDADKAVAAQKMRGGARRSMVELGAAATYATWYFSSVKDPFGTGATIGQHRPRDRLEGGQGARPEDAPEVPRAPAAGPLSGARGPGLNGVAPFKPGPSGCVDVATGSVGGQTRITRTPSAPSSGLKSSSCVTTGSPLAAAVAAIHQIVDVDAPAVLREMHPQARPFGGDVSIDRQDLDVGGGIEGRQPPCAGVDVGGNEHSRLQLGDRHRADHAPVRQHRRVDRPIRLEGDEHARVEKAVRRGRHQRIGPRSSVVSPANTARSLRSPASACARLKRRVSSARAIGRLRTARTGINSATGRPRDVIVTCSPASTLRSMSAVRLRSSRAAISLMRQM